MILKYKLNPDGSIPDFITDGGYFAESDGTLVGIADDAQPVPKGTSEISIAELKNRVSGIILVDAQETPKTSDEIVDMWATEKGLL